MTSPTTQTWGLSLPLGEAWFDLPLDDEATQASYEARVDARIAREPDLAGSRDSLVKMIAHFARDARMRGAVGGALYWKRHDLDVVSVATLYTTVCPRSDGPVSDEIERLRSQLDERYATDRFEPAVDVCDLPAGQALRVRVISDTEQDENEQWVALLETVQYWIPVPGWPACLLLNFSTPNLAGAEPLVTEFDQIARRLDLRS